MDVVGQGPRLESRTGCDRIHREYGGDPVRRRVSSRRGRGSRRRVSRTVRHPRVPYQGFSTPLLLTPYPSYLGEDFLVGKTVCVVCKTKTFLNYCVTVNKYL